MRLGWRPLALADRNAIMDYIAEGNPTAALALDE
jgi:plasmid stabilization system protein ParE